MQAWFTLAYLIDEDSIDAVLGPAILLLILGTLAWIGYRRWRLGYGSSRWTMVDAIIQSEFVSAPYSPGPNAAVGGAVASAAASRLCKAVIQYSYQVAGEFYSGYFMLAGTFSSSEDASAAVRPWLHRKIVVRYNPALPQESAFLPNDGAPAGSRSLGNQPPSPSDVIIVGAGSS